MARGEKDRECSPMFYFDDHPHRLLRYSQAMCAELGQPGDIASGRCTRALRARAVRWPYPRARR